MVMFRIVLLGYVCVLAHICPLFGSTLTTIHHDLLSSRGCPVAKNYSVLHRLQDCSISPEIKTVIRYITTRISLTRIHRIDRPQTKLV